MRSALARSARRRYAHSAAFTLLESTIALAILSIGLLGGARMFVEALQSHQSNAAHRAAISLSEELISRMKIARAGIADDDFIDCRIIVNDCFGDPDVAAWLAGWRRELRRRLANADAVLSVLRRADTQTYRIEISWTGMGAKPQSQRFEFVLRI